MIGGVSCPCMTYSNLFLWRPTLLWGSPGNWKEKRPPPCKAGPSLTVSPYWIGASRITLANGHVMCFYWDNGEERVGQQLSAWGRFQVLPVSYYLTIQKKPWIIGMWKRGGSSVVSYWSNWEKGNENIKEKSQKWETSHATHLKYQSMALQYSYVYSGCLFLNVLCICCFVFAITDTFTFYSYMIQSLSVLIFSKFIWKPCKHFSLFSAPF